MKLSRLKGPGCNWRWQWRYSQHAMHTCTKTWSSTWISWKDFLDIMTQSCKSLHSRSWGRRIQVQRQLTLHSHTLSQEKMVIIINNNNNAETWKKCFCCAVMLTHDKTAIKRLCNLHCVINLGHTHTHIPGLGWTVEVWNKDSIK